SQAGARALNSLKIWQFMAELWLPELRAFGSLRAPLKRSRADRPLGSAWSIRPINVFKNEGHFK
ncbi:MAG: hypothetical protein ABI191_04030, partial [Rhizomicrobium sp.]